MPGRETSVDTGTENEKPSVQEATGIWLRLEVDREARGPWRGGEASAAGRGLFPVFTGDSVGVSRPPTCSARVSAAPSEVLSFSCRGYREYLRCEKVQRRSMSSWATLHGGIGDR